MEKNVIYYLGTYFCQVTIWATSDAKVLFSFNEFYLDNSIMKLKNISPKKQVILFLFYFGIYFLASCFGQTTMKCEHEAYIMIYDQSIQYLFAMYKIQIPKCSKVCYDLLCVFQKLFSYVIEQKSEVNTYITQYVIITQLMQIFRFQICSYLVSSYLLVSNQGQKVVKAKKCFLSIMKEIRKEFNICSNIWYV